MQYVIKETNEITTLRKYWKGFNLAVMSDEQRATQAGWWKITSITGQDYNADTHIQGEPVITYDLDNHTASVTYPLTPRSIDDRKARIANERWLRMVGGVTYQEHEIDTSDASQARLTGIVLAYQSGVLTGTVEYKTKTGWLTLDADAVSELAQVVVAHIQDCFAWEREQVENLT
jgi:hypothetical protein